MLYFSSASLSSFVHLAARTTWCRAQADRFPTSPFARKVRIALAEKKYEYQLVEATPWGTDNAVHAWNPLGKLPVLLLDDGTPSTIRA